jgi:anti-sigma factor RsiW
MNDHLSTDLLVDYLHGELAPEDDALAHAHLAACPECRSSYDLEASLTEALRTAAKAGEQEMPSLVAAAVWEQIRQAKPGPLARLAAFLRPAISVPVAAALVLGVWFASPYSHPGAPPRIDAMYYLEAHAAEAGSPLTEQSGSPVLETSLLDEPTAPLIAEHDSTGYASSALVADR